MRARGLPRVSPRAVSRDPRRCRTRRALPRLAGRPACPCRAGTPRFALGKRTMWTARCIAYLSDGRICLEPAEYLDPVRKGLVCEHHRPKASCCEARRKQLSAEREAASSGLIDCLLRLELYS